MPEYETIELLPKNVERLRKNAKKREEEMISRRRVYLDNLDKQNPDFNLRVYNPWDTPADYTTWSENPSHLRHAKTEAQRGIIKRMLTAMRHRNSWTGKIMERPPPPPPAASPPAASPPAASPPAASPPAASPTPSQSRLEKIINFFKKRPSRGTTVHPAPAGGGKRSKRCKSKRNKTNNNKNKMSSRRRNKCKGRRTRTIKK